MLYISFSFPIGTKYATEYPCTAGTYTNRTSNVRWEVCEDCTAGNYCPQGSSLPTACPKGRYRDTLRGKALGKIFFLFIFNCYSFPFHQVSHSRSVYICYIFAKIGNIVLMFLLLCTRIFAHFYLFNTDFNIDFNIDFKAFDALVKVFKLFFCKRIFGKTTQNLF